MKNVTKNIKKIPGFSAYSLNLDSKKVYNTETGKEITIQAKIGKFQLKNDAEKRVVISLDAITALLPIKAGKVTKAPKGDIATWVAKTVIVSDFTEGQKVSFVKRATKETLKGTIKRVYTFREKLWAEILVDGVVHFKNLSGVIK